MRILQVTPYYAPAWAYGGPPRVMCDFATGLAARGHTVDVLTTDVLDAEHRAGPSREVVDGVRVRRLPNLSNRLAWRSKKYLPRGLVTMLVRDAGRYDVVHATDARTVLTAAAYLAARRAGVPFCLSAHGSLPGSAGVRGAVKRVYDAALVDPMIRTAALLLAQTEHEADLYAKHGGASDAIRLLPLPLPPLDDEQAAPAGSFRRSLGLPDTTRLLLFLGRINRLKGLDVLIESVAPLLGDDLRLAVVGRDDGHLDEIRTRFGSLLARRHLILAGPLYGSARFTAYRDADVFCLTPTHWEETSVAALEAAACGTPVVVSEQADLPGLSAAGGGFVVPLDTDAIRAATTEALAAEGTMGERARSHVLEQHGRRAVVERLEGYLADITSARRTT